MKGEEQPGHEILFWEHEGARAIRNGDWKLVVNYYDITAELEEIIKKEHTPSPFWPLKSELN